jgi:Tol biopolymer transport system component
MHPFAQTRMIRTSLLLLMLTGTASAHALELGDAAAADPQLSPDGEHLLFRSARGGSWKLWLGDANGHDARAITGEASNDAMPAHDYGGEGPARCSSDGRFVAFDSDRGGDNEIYLVDADGGTPRRVSYSAGSDLAPLWVRVPKEKAR